MLAATLGNADGVRQFADEARRVNEEGYTALMFAVWYGTPEVAKLLIPLEAGLTDLKGRTAVWCILENCCFPKAPFMKLLAPIEVNGISSKFRLCSNPYVQQAINSSKYAG